MCEFKAMEKLEDDIKTAVEEVVNDKVYELQMSIDQLVMDCIEEARSSALEEIKDKFGEDMAARFDETCDLDDQIDQQVRDEIHV